MISAFVNTFRVQELRNRVLYTLMLIIIIRLGVHITIPGVDAGVIKAWMDDLQRNTDPQNPTGGIAALLTVFSGGGLQQAGIFALGIMPYISASIMMQLMTVIIPQLAKLAREDGGRQKISKYTKIAALIIAVIQAYFVTKSLMNPASLPLMRGVEQFGNLVQDTGFLSWQLPAIFIVVAGTMLVMWIGDQITDKGIGNGTSIIITVNIISSLPGALIQAWKYFVTDSEGVGRSLLMVVMIALLLFVIAATVALTQGQRRIAVQYAKRMVGRKQFGGQTQYLPLKVNYAGVMPIIFATTVLSLPAMTLGMIPSIANKPFVIKFIGSLNGGTAHYVCGGVGIFLFSFFWVTLMFQPSQISEDLKRNGGYIPGIRPGKPTAEFLDFTMSRLTFAGAIFLALLFVLPTIVGAMVALPPSSLILHFFGGTSLLIMVGVVLDTMRQVETQLIQKNYDGFLRQGKLKGRYDRLASNGKGASDQSLVYLALVVAILLILGVTAYFWKY